MNDEGRTQREINEGGEAGRRRACSKRGSECWREELRRREGVREIRAGQAGEAEGGGRREGREGGRHQCSVPGIVMHRSMPVVVSIHSVLTSWREGLRVVVRARREPEKEGGTSCC